MWPTFQQFGNFAPHTGTDTHTPDRQITEKRNGVARLPGRNSGQKAQKGPQKKNFWPNFGGFYQKQAEKGPQKIFKRCSFF